VAGIRSIVIAGASGFIGSALREHFAAIGDDVRLIGRSADITWADATAIDEAVAGSDILINLAGKSVNCRYTESARREILRSRVETTRMLRHAVARAATPPGVWINASTATIYRHEEERANTEERGVLGTGFSVDVAREWEREFFAGTLPSTRRVALRMAIVLGDGPAAELLVRLARSGLGGTQCDGWAPQHRRYRGIGAAPSGDGRVPHHRTHGRQKFSWVHIDDVVGALEFVVGRPDLRGPVNLAAPEVVDNRTLMASLRRAAGVPFGLPATRWMLEAAMWAMRTEPELVVKSRWVAPAALLSAGYTFRHPTLDAAVNDLVASRR
jgi:NAD dependent epimerase/dehydratase family enzyme